MNTCVSVHPNSGHLIQSIKLVDFQKQKRGIHHLGPVW